MIVMYQCGFISDNKCTTLVGKSLMHGRRGMWEILSLPLHFAANLNLLQKVLFLFKRKLIPFDLEISLLGIYSTEIAKSPWLV